MAVELVLHPWDSVSLGRMLGTDRDGGAELEYESLKVMGSVWSRL